MENPEDNLIDTDKKRERRTPITETRRVFKIGDSLAITLPKKFTKAHDIEDGDDLSIVADHILKVIPMAET